MDKEEKVTNILNSFLEKMGYNDLIAEYIHLSDSFYISQGSTGNVVLGGLADKEADKIFMKYCKQLGLNIEVSVETMTFLHEVSHHNTIDFLDDDELLDSELIKLTLYMQNEQTEENFMKYFTCPIEKEATVDAVNFCIKYPSIVQNLDKELLVALYD